MDVKEGVGGARGPEPADTAVSPGPAAIAVERRPAPAEHAASVERVPRRRSEWLVRLALVQADIVAILLAYFIAHAFVPDQTSGHFMLLTLILSLPLWMIALHGAGLYQRDNQVIGHTTLDELPALLLIATIGSWLLFLFCATSGNGKPVGLIEAFWLGLVTLQPATRAFARRLVRRSANFAQNTVIVGAGAVGQILGRKLLDHPEYRLELIGFVDEQPKERREDLDSLAMLGRPDELARIVEEYAIERVMIAFSNDSHEETLQLIRLLKDLNVRVDIVPRLFEIIPGSLMSQTIAGIPLISLPRLRLSAQSRFLKRSFDLVVSLALTLVLTPLFAIVATLIKLDSPGPVLFRQNRMGAEGKTFVIFKFRTMSADADQQKDQIAHLNVHANRGGDPRMFKIREDPRVTRVGQLLRRFSLDEFPQLLNVIRGDMSLVGPRPLILEEDVHVDAWARRRLMLKPGMTGLWQVSGRNSIPFEEMVRLDYLYVTTWSLAHDIRLILKTFPLVFGGERGGHW